MPQAQELMLARQVDGIVRIRPDFARHLSLGDAEVQVLVHGTDANRARIIQGYAQGAVGQWAARRAAEGKAVAARAGRRAQTGSGSTRPTTATTSSSPA